MNQRAAVPQPTGLAQIQAWYQQRGWKPFAFQRACWTSYRRGEDFLLHSTTGSGKTLAAWLGPVIEFLNRPTDTSTWSKKRGKPVAPPLTVLWITPLRSLSADTEASLRQPIQDLNLPWTIQRRTGDSSSSIKAGQKKQLPTALITTPESLLLLLSYPTAQEQFRQLKLIVVDEWHELLGTKRGVQTELALAWLSQLAPQAVRCGLSATLGNTQQALEVLCGYNRTQRRQCIAGLTNKKISVKSVVPPKMERFPWAGHLGLSMLSPVIEAIESAQSTLIFTNTRNQTEQWYQKLLAARPDWSGNIALHHGSLDARVRAWVEDALRKGQLKAVVCTSSLDLGVDFSAVDLVLQIGSPKGAARLLQRAGRSGHRPGEVSRLLFVPTHAFELVELAAARNLVERQSASPKRGSSLSNLNPSVLESRRPILNPMDCLTQHAVTRSLSGSYSSDELLAELRSTYCFRNLPAEDLNWALRFVVHGGETLRAYPDFHRVQLEQGRYQVTDPAVARRHRMAMGTITGDLVMQVKYASGKTLGTVEESYLSKLKPGDCFQFAGKTLELMFLREGVAIVKKSKRQPNTTPRWAGGRMPLSTQLADEVRDCLDKAAEGKFAGVELASLRPIFELQSQWSRIPRHGELLVENFCFRRSFFACLYPFEGRLVHEGLSALIACRYTQQRAATLSIAVNEYGFMFQSNQPLVLDEAEILSWFNDRNLVDELLQSVNSTELAKRQFREIARIAGLIHPGIPGQPKPGRHLQASANMFFDTFRQYDPEHKLLLQAEQELLENQFEIERCRVAMRRILNSKITICSPPRPSPLAFPLIVEQLRQRLSTEPLDERVRKLQAQLEQSSP